MAIGRRAIKGVLLGLFLCLVLYVGITSWLVYGDCTSLPTRLFHQLVRGDKDFFGKNTRFKVRMMGSGRTPEGYDTDFTILRASDCVKVTIETVSMSSPTEAESEMEKKIRNASRVVEHRAKLNLPTPPDGERAVLLFDGDARAEIVLWFKGNSRLLTIESTSLAHALACEKLTQRGYRMNPQGYVVPSGQ